MSKHSVRRQNPIRIQTANDVVEFTEEHIFDIEKLKQSITAVVGREAPDLLSVGYRCHGLVYGFFWPPNCISYFVLPDGKTEVDLEVDQFVPYLLDTSDTAIHKASSSSRCSPVVLIQNNSLDNSMGEVSIFEKQHCGPFTMPVSSQLWTLHND